ncbi:MAG: type II toxin-antitoxin system HicA family toxin [Armatimonadota bacterium]
MKVRELLRLLEQNGWRLARFEGSHRQLTHPSRPGVLTVAGNLGRDVPPGILRAVLKAAGIREGTQ